MGVLLFAYRQLSLIRRKHELNYRLTQLTQKLMDLQDYASSVADGQVSMNDLMRTPCSMFNRMNMFMQYSHQASITGAQQKYQMMLAIPGAIPQIPDPAQQQMYQQAIFKNLYEQEKEKFSKAEERLLAQQNKKIELEKTKLEQQLKMIETELETVGKAGEKAQEASAPKYVA